MKSSRSGSLAVLAAAIAVAGCPRSADPDRAEEPARTGDPGRTDMSGEVIPWPASWADHVGQTVTVEGRALEAKLGPLLAGDGPDLWIDGLSAWPEGFYRGGEEGARVRVTGTVIERSDLPVFIEDGSGPARAGMPAAPGTDLADARKRHLLTGATWILLDPVRTGLP
jgi:hypothetical protein